MSRLIFGLAFIYGIGVFALGLTGHMGAAANLSQLLFGLIVAGTITYVAETY